MLQEEKKHQEEAVDKGGAPSTSISGAQSNGSG